MPNQILKDPERLRANLPYPYACLCYCQTEIYENLISFFNFYQTPIIDGSISSAASSIIIEVQQQIEKMARLQWEWQRSVITSIHNVPC